MAVDFSPKVIACFFCRNSVRIGQNFPNEVPDLSSPILLITILIAEIESLMGLRKNNKRGSTWTENDQRGRQGGLLFSQLFILDKSTTFEAVRIEHAVLKMRKLFKITVGKH